MNADGTIAGAPGLNLTDGNGRIIPVNLSVSIPMSSIVEGSEDDESNETTECSTHSLNAMYQNTNTTTKLQPVMEMVTDDSGEITPRQSHPSMYCFKQTSYH